MDRLIDDITDRYISRLPGDRQYFTAEELRGLDLPAFLTRRILLQLRRNLLESLPEPRSEWADLQSPEVIRRWEDFLENAGNVLRLPRDRAREVCREAVRGCLELLVRPREVIPSLLFGSDLELDRSRLERRLAWLVVYSHFHSLLPRYMEKKDLESLDRDRCASIISRADRKFCQRYDAEAWVGLLEPLFELTGGQVPSSLLADFFRDKERPVLADRLDKRGGELDRGELQEHLSGDKEETASPASSAGENGSGTSPGERTPEHGAEPGEDHAPGASEDPDDGSLNTLFSQETEDIVEIEETVREEAAGEQPAGEEEEEHTPMWMRYLEPGEEPEVEAATDEAGLDKDYEQEEEPLFEPDDPDRGDSKGSGQAARLKKGMEDQRDYFVKEIFGGSGSAYDRALEEIASRDDWRSASRYIEQEIFKRNLVDMYSEQAVDFTDRLQSWFTDPSNNES